MKAILTASILGITCAASTAESRSQETAKKPAANREATDATSVSLSARRGTNPAATYQLRGKLNRNLSVESACYFHPFTTPAGITVTEVAPDDHRHHRGIFLAFVEMHGKVDADFWGWGEHAPKENRVIVNREHRSNGELVADNEWRASNDVIIREHLVASLSSDFKNANVLDLTYTLTPQTDVALSRWAFSGFCVRTRKDARLTAYSPDGEVKLPNPSHLKPDSDWPAGPWYAYELRLDDGRTVGVAVVDHPSNPPSLWHNHRDVRMLNPSIVAPAELKLTAAAPLVLRYRVAAYDGQTSIDHLNQLAEDFRQRE
jgi:Family of unknown function (DUF6807)